MPEPTMAMAESPRSRLSSIHSNVRNMLRNPIPSSIYSRATHGSAAPTPRVPPLPQLPQLAFLGRHNTAGDDEIQPVLDQSDRHLNDAHNRRDSTGSPISQGFGISRNASPVRRISMWHEQPEPVTMALGRPSSHDERDDPYDEEADVGMEVHSTDEIADDIERDGAHHVRRKRRRRHCKRCRKGRGAWLKHSHRKPLWKGRIKVKAIGAVISGIFLIVLLGAYLSIALTQSQLGQEIHILFILAILGDTVFFAHCLIRLCMLVHRKPSSGRNRRGPMLAMCTPEGFQPEQPVRVHLAADDEALQDCGHVEGARDAPPSESESGGKKLLVPPPAYGLWRSSVRINPNLLHWARVDQPATPTNPFSTPVLHTGDQHSPEMQQRDVGPQAPRPPSYVSDDGVAYVVQAEPRSTTLMPSMRPPSALHPALRAGMRDADASSDDGSGMIAVGLGLDERGR